MISYAGYIPATSVNLVLSYRPKGRVRRHACTRALLTPYFILNAYACST